MTSLRFRRLAFVLTSVMIASLLASCGGSTADEKTTAAPNVTGAVSATRTVYLRAIKTVTRASPLMGIFTNLYMANGGYVPVVAAKDGVLAQVKFASASNTNLDNTFQLLQEFAGILQVDVPDLLNRSDNRASTLDEYLTGLQNITERARRRLAELEQGLDNLRTQQRDQRRANDDIERNIRRASQANDYVTAGALQQELGPSEAALAQTDANVKQQTDVIQTYEDLIELSDERLQAIRQNREVMIAGLKVVNVPGTEDLGVLEGQNSIRSRLGF